MIQTFLSRRFSITHFCIAILTTLLLGEAIMQAPVSLTSLALAADEPTEIGSTMTKALSNRLGQSNDDTESDSILVDSPPIQASASSAAPNVEKATVEPLFSERTANHLNLVGQSPNDPSRKRLALGDFNNDGNEDIIVARWTANAQLFINVSGVMTLTNSAFANQSDTANARHAGVLDANGDGWQDLILRNKLLFNLGEDINGNWQGFSAGQTIAGAELDPFTIQTADFDGDGDIDAATSPGRRMLVNDGAGNLASDPSRMDTSILLNVIKFDARDFDGDGDIDLAGPEISEQRHFVYYNDGTGNFNDSLRLSLPLDTLTYTQVGADFNGDNIADFRIYADNQFPRAFVSTGTFDGAFPQYIRRNDGNLFGDNGKHGLAHIRDIDGDGDLDFILSSLELFIDRVDSLNEKTEIIVNRDINSGTFEVYANPEYRDEESFDAKITDVNLDGNMDLFIAHQGRLAVYINDAPPKIIEITGQSNTPSAVNEASSFAISVTGASGSVATNWDMGDGTTINSGGSFAVDHAYTEPGRYLVTVSVDNGVNVDSLVFWHTVYAQQTSVRPNNSATIIFEDLGAGNGRVWSVNPDHDTVSAVDSTNNTLVAEIPVGDNPNSLAFGGDGRLYVANKGDGSISIIDTASFSVNSTFTGLPSASQPHGIVFDPTPGSMLAFVTLEASGQLAKIDFSSDTVTIENIGPFPRELSINATGSIVYVSRFISAPVPGEDSRIVSTATGGEVWMVDANSLQTTGSIAVPFNNQPDTTSSSRGVPNYLMAPVIAPSGTSAFVPANVSNIYRGQFRDGQNREHNKLVRSMLAKLDLQSGQELIADRHDFDNSAQPTAGAFDPTGNYLYLVFEASRKLRIYDIHSGNVLNSLDVGFAPRGVTLSSDGTKVFVDNYLSRSLHVFDATDFIAGNSVEHSLVTETPKAGAEPLSPTLLLGKQLFFDAADERLSAQSYISCATCHADGGHDGRTWDFSDVGEGLRNTIDLRGRTGMGHGLVHWTANFDEIQDFENDIRDIFQGTGLLSDTDFNNNAATLGSPKAGLSAELDALAAFVASLDNFGPSPYRLESGEKTAAAIAGEQVFVASNCVACHSGSEFTNSPAGNNFSDIGTVDADTGGRLGGPLIDGGLDTPTLKGLWNGAPYLHDGSAATVEDAILAHTSPEVGFDVSSLSATELTNLSAYLLELEDADIANTPPTLINPGAQSTQTGISVNLQIQANDPDTGNTLSFSATGLPDGLSINASGLITGVPTLTGVYNTTVSVDDGASGSDSTSFNWTITATPNSPPTANSGPDQTLTDTDGNGSETVTLDGSASTDNDGNITSYVWTDSTGSVIANGVTAQADFAVGTHTVTLTVTDNDGASDTASSTITVEPQPNNAPTITNPGDQENLLSSPVSLSILANDPDIGDTLTYTASGLPDGLIIDAATGVISGVTAVAGSFAPTVTVTDNSGSSASTSFQWVVTGGLVCTIYNSTDTPINLPNQVAAINSNLAINTNSIDPITSVIVNVDMAHDWVGDLTLTLTHQETGSSAVLLDRPGVPASQYGCQQDDLLISLNDDSSNNAETTCNTNPPTLNGDFAPVSALSVFNQETAGGTWILTVDDAYIAADAGVLNSWSVEICTDGGGAVNQPPSADAGNNQTVVDADNNGSETVALSAANSTDSDGVIVNYQWSSDTGVPIPSGVTPTADFAVGSHTVTLQVTDNAGATATDSVIIVVEAAPNSPPIAVNPGAQLSALGEVISLQIDASDPDTNDTLNFSQNGLPDGLDIDSNTGEISGTLSAIGEFNPLITVTDNAGASTTVEFQWTVQAGVACNVYSSSDVPIAIPVQTASISSDLLVSTSGAITDVNVSVDMLHEWIGDITITLTHQPSNTNVVLIDRPGVPASQWGCREDDLLITLDDDATANAETTCGATAPTLNGDFAPAAPLSAFNQTAANGTWTLTVDDDYVAADAGELRAWSIEICTTAGAVNEAPVAAAGNDISVTDTDNSGFETIALSGTASTDVDGSIVSYNWSSDTGVVINAGATTTAEFAVGTHIVTLEVTDDDGATATDTVTVTVLPAPNSAPDVVNPGDQTSLLGTPLNLTISANDPDAGDTLTYSQTGLPNGLVIDSISGEISGTPTTAGAFNTSITVTDNSGASSSVNFVWTIQTEVVCTVYESTDIPVALPNQTASITSGILVNNNNTIVDVNVTVAMEHDWVGDLTFTLTHPVTNTSVVLVDRPGVPASQWGCARDDLAVVWDDSANNTAENACSNATPTINGNFAPQQALSAFNQKIANGPWELKIDDAYIAADAGVLNNWSIEICTQ